MTLHFKIPILFVFCQTLFLNASFGQFAAEMKNVIQGREMIYHVSSDGTMYRYDFNLDGEPTVVIVDEAQRKMHILVPNKKFIHTTDLDSRMSLMNDPVQAFRRYAKMYDANSIGSEKIGEFNTNIIELAASGQKLFTCWMCEELKFPIKLVNEQGIDTYMELSNIQKKKVDPSLFILPEDFIAVDDQMRPVIPEPPAPESWNEIELSVPINRVLKRGDRVRFKVNHTSYTKMRFTNESEKPTKIMYQECNADGEKKSHDEQGIDRMRTYRLFTDEFKSLTNAFKEGDINMLEVFEGEVHVDVKPDN